MKTGIELITDERQRQVDAEGWTPEHDDKYTNDELPSAAVSYALPDGDPAELEAERKASKSLAIIAIYEYLTGSKDSDADCARALGIDLERVQELLPETKVEQCTVCSTWCLRDERGVQDGDFICEDCEK